MAGAVPSYWLSYMNGRHTELPSRFIQLSAPFPLIHSANFKAGLLERADRGGKKKKKIKKKKGELK